MSKLGPNQMTVRKVSSLKDGAHSDGGNLWITVAGNSRVWSIRFKSPITGKRREMGIGSAKEITLAEARLLAADVRRLLREGKDPIDQRRAGKAALVRQTALTFQVVAEQYIEDQKAGWRDPRMVATWSGSLTRMAYPTIGEKAVANISTDDVVAVLRPVWATKTETADRVRGRMERILDYAQTQGWRQGENPARWKGHLSNILPRPSTVVREQHHAAVAWKDIGPVMAALARSEGMGALAVRFVCLTAARSGEVRGAKWAEINLETSTWTISAERMKAAREHRVPLSGAAMEIVLTLKPLGADKAALVFPGGRPKKPLSDVALSKALHLAAGTRGVTVHGLRSTFRDWVAEATEYPRDVAEMALAHAIGDKVEAAYRRGDLFGKRRALMEEWGRFSA